MRPLARRVNQRERRDLAFSRPRGRANTKARLHTPECPGARFATCGSRHAVGLDVVVTVGPNALLFFWHGYADPAPQTRAGPRIHVPRGLWARSARALVLAIGAHRVLAGRRGFRANASSIERSTTALTTSFAAAAPVAAAWPLAPKPGHDFDIVSTGSNCRYRTRAVVATSPAAVPWTTPASP